MEKNPLEYMHGGDHYKRAMQPVELFSILGIAEAAFLANMIKYPSRHRDKAGVMDLDKTDHYLDFMRAEKEGTLCRDYFESDYDALKHYCSVNGLDEYQTEIIGCIYMYNITDEIEWYYKAKHVLKEYKELEYGKSK